VRALLVDIGANASRVPLVGAALPASYIALESVAAIAATRPDAHGHVVPVRSWKAWRQLGRVAGIERAAPDVARLVAVPSTPRRLTVSARQRSLSVAHRSSNVELLAATDDDTEVDESGKPLDDDVDDDALKRATTALHLLGSVVWFDDDVLCDLVILSTQWLSDAISTVLTTKHKLVKNGLMDAHSLPLIWKPPQFPERLHGRLVALLSQFELLHALSETRFLVPSMLPPQTPEDASMRMKVLAVPAGDAAVRRYERRFALDFVPHGLFSRLLVRLLRFVPVVRYWDGGALLSEAAEGNAGAVLLDGDAIRIVVVGRKVVPLLEDVVETFRALTDGWYSLEMACTVPCAHCASGRTATEFALADLEAAIADGKSAVTCAPSGESVPLELLVPDLLLLAKRGWRWTTSRR
jgi:hypothetical protein